MNSQWVVGRGLTVNPDFMYSDDFNGFFNNRKELILQRIENAMEKQIPREQLIEEEGKFIDISIEEDDE